VNDERRWLYAAVDPETNEFLHVRLFSTKTTQLIVLSLRELQQHMPVTQATISVDDAYHLKDALSRLKL
jgi:putative transposase